MTQLMDEHQDGEVLCALNAMQHFSNQQSQFPHPLGEIRGRELLGVLDDGRDEALDTCRSTWKAGCDQKPVRRCEAFAAAGRYGTFSLAGLLDVR